MGILVKSKKLRATFQDNITFFPQFFFQRLLKSLPTINTAAW